MKYSIKHTVGIILLWLFSFFVSMCYQMPEASGEPLPTIKVEGLALVDGSTTVEFQYEETIDGVLLLYDRDVDTNIYFILEDQWEGEVQEYKVFHDYLLIGYAYEEGDVIIFENLEGDYFK